MFVGLVGCAAPLPSGMGEHEIAIAEPEGFRK